MNCTNFIDLISNIGAYVIIGIAVLGSVIVAIVRAIKGID